MLKQTLNIKNFSFPFRLSAFRSAADSGIIATLSSESLPDCRAYFLADGQLDPECNRITDDDIESAVIAAVQAAIAKGSL